MCFPRQLDASLSVRQCPTAVTRHASAIEFRPLRTDDFATLWEWHQRPHVARWFAPYMPETYDECVREWSDMVERRVPERGFLIVVDGREAGYIQSYRLNDAPEMAVPLALGEDAVAADLFIADESLLGRGVGARVVATFYLRMMEESGLEVGIIDPEVENARAIRAYEKAGFSVLRDVDTGGRSRERMMRATRESLEAALRAMG